jgi:hypothetical protein
VICILPQPNVSKFPGVCFGLNTGEQRGSAFLCTALVKKVSVLSPLALLLKCSIKLKTGVA